MKKTEKESLDRFEVRRILQRASKIGVYITSIAGVLDAMAGNAAAQTGDAFSGLKPIAYILTGCIIAIAVLIIRLMVKYYNRRNFDAGLNEGKEVGRE
jgi:hypothetical protein